MLQPRPMRSRNVPERSPVGFGRRDAPVSGPVTPASVPFPAGATKLDDDIVATLIPERKARGHKGSFGKLLVIAGSLDYAGAALLVCRAAGRTGVGLVTLAVPELLQPLFAAKVDRGDDDGASRGRRRRDRPGARPRPHPRPRARRDRRRAGPAARASRRPTSSARCSCRLGRADATPLVLDAEALRSMATIDGWWEGDRRPAVLTPHAGEFARLRAGSGEGPDDDGDVNDDDEARLAAALEAAATWRSVVVLKGARTIIAAPGRRRGHRPVREPGARDRRHGRRAGGRDRVAPGPGTGAVRGGPARRLPPRAVGRRRSRAVR